MTLTNISYDEIQPGTLLRAIWERRGVQVTIEGVPFRKTEDDFWENGFGIPLVYANFTPERMYSVEPDSESDIIQDVCEPVHYSEISPGDRIHVIYTAKDKDATTHYEGIVSIIDSVGVKTDEGGLILAVDDVDDAIIMRLYAEASHQNPAFCPVVIEEIQENDFISSEWYADDVSYLLYGRVYAKIDEGWITEGSVCIVNVEWDGVTYEISDDDYAYDYITGWMESELTEVQRGDLVCVFNKIDDAGMVREGVVGDVHNGWIYSTAGQVLRSGSGTIYRLPRYDED